MSFFDAARHRLRTLFRPGAADRERDEEYEFHRSLAEAEHVRATGDVWDAPYAARRELGNSTYLKEEQRSMGAIRWIDQLGQDLRFAWRTFRRAPAFTMVAVLSIGLSIGANTAVFGVIDEVMLKRLAVSHPEQLIQLLRDDGRGGRDVFFNVAEYNALRAASGVDISVITSASAPQAEIAGTKYGPLQFNAVDGAFFPMLGVGVAAGRLLTPADDRDAAPVAVLGFRSAVRYFGSARDAVGQTIKLQGHVFTIVGVLPREFRGPSLGWPMTIVVPRTVGPLLRNTRSPLDGKMLRLITRAADGEQTRVALERAFAGCCANGELVTRETRGNLRADGQRLVLTGMSGGMAGEKVEVREMFGRVLYTLMAGVTIILLIACTNVGSLLLARATARSRELAVRMSLGASRGRVVRQLLTESVLLATIGAAVGIVIAIWGTAILSERLPGELRRLQPFMAIAPNRSVIGFTAGVAAICTIICGVLPAIRATRVDPVVGLRTASPGSVRSGRLDRGIIAFQMALALVFVAAAGLLDATISSLRSGLGDMPLDQVLVAEVDTRGSSIGRGGERPIYDQMLERLRAVPGVSSVAGADGMPTMMGGFMSMRMLNIAGHEPAADVPLERSGFGANVIHTTAGFFATTGSGLVAGREFTDGDIAGAPPVVIINEALARKFFPGRDAIGQMIGFYPQSRDLRVIGVARDVKQFDLRAAAPPITYLPRTQRRSDHSTFTFAIRTEGQASTLTHAARTAILHVVPNIELSDVQPMSSLITDSIARERALAAVALLFSVVAVGLAAIGLYGVMAFQVTSRSREIGIRMALGAGRPQVVGMVMRQSLFVVVAGVGVGVPLALGASSGLRALLYGVEPFAPAPFVLAALVLVGAGIVAALLPSRNAARVDPLIAIRSE